MRYGNLRRKVDHCRRVLDDAKQRRVEELAGVSVPIPDIGTRVQSGGNSDPTYTITERLIMYHDERVSKAIENLRRAEFELDEVQSMIDRAMLTETEKKYVELRYVIQLTIAETAEQMGYSCRNVNLVSLRVKNKLANIKIFVDKYNNMC